MRWLLLLLASLTTVAPAAPSDANRLNYLDAADPYYPHLGLARFTTPQWVGEPDVEAVVILALLLLDVWSRRVAPVAKAGAVAA